MESMNVCVIGGAGYVGLITGLGLAEIGHQVTNVDVDQGRIRKLQVGESPICEEGIEPLLKRNLDAGRLRFSTDLVAAIKSSRVVFIAVGTPSLEDGQADLSNVIQVTQDLSRHMAAYTVLVIKSTVPTGTVEIVQSILRQEKQEGKDFDLVANPEFLREGKGLYDFFYPERIVIGTGSEQARRVMRALYQPIVEGGTSWLDKGPRPGRPCPVPVVETDLTSAQMIKYASNAFLAARISFINEVAGLCEKVGADIKEVVRGMGYDPRIGHAYLQAGLGFGGPCLEKDLRSLISIAEGNGHEPQLLRAVLERNGKQVDQMVAKLKQLSGHLLPGKIVAVFGLAFKAGTNDVRNSLALKVIDRLEREGAIVQAHDPMAIPEARALKPHLAYYDDPYEAVRHADGLLILTEWPCYSQMDYGKIKARMATSCIVDGRNLLDPRALAALGFTYVGVGRP
jgi:UDPglucose 6-dehydrogenase